MLAILVNLVILVTVVNLVILGNMAILVILVNWMIMVIMSCSGKSDDSDYFCKLGDSGIS